jgi:hypothetical protein
MLKHVGLGLEVVFGIYTLSSAVASACDWRVGGCGPNGYYAPSLRYNASYPVYYAPPRVYAEDVNCGRGPPSK